MLYYLLVCLLGAIISTGLYMFFHRRYHERNLATADRVECCDRYRFESHTRTFRILSKITYVPFLAAFLSPLFLEYGLSPVDLEMGKKYYLAEDGKYKEIGFFVLDNRPIVAVTSLAAAGPKLTYMVERDGKVRYANIMVSFSYPQDPEDFAKIPMKLRNLDFPNNQEAPEIVDFMRAFHRFLLESNDAILYNLATINAAESSEANREFTRRLTNILANQNAPFGIRARVFSAQIKEF